MQPCPLGQLGSTVLKGHKHKLALGCALSEHLFWNKKPVDAQRCWFRWEESDKKGMSVSTAEKSIFFFLQHRPKLTSVHFSSFLIGHIQLFILYRHTRCFKDYWTVTVCVSMKEHKQKWKERWHEIWWLHLDNLRYDFTFGMIVVYHITDHLSCVFSLMVSHISKVASIAQLSRKDYLLNQLINWQS